MRKKLISLVAGIILPVLAAAQQHLSTWHNRPENNRDVITKQVGEINERTQGVVTIYGADWCGPCNELEKQIEEKHLDEKLAKEGIVFRYIKNQNQDNDKTKPRVNEHIQKDSNWFRQNLNGVPCIFIDDLGRSFEGDKTELATHNLRKFKGLEEYIERYALDRQVSLLTEQEQLKVAEGIGSSFYDVEFTVLYDNGRTGFKFTPKNRVDAATKESIQRLHLVENAVLLWDGNVVKKYNPQPIDKPIYFPTDEQIAQIKVSKDCEKDFQTELHYLQEKIAEVKSKN